MLIKLLINIIYYDLIRKLLLDKNKETFKTVFLKDEFERFLTRTDIRQDLNAKLDRIKLRGSFFFLIMKKHKTNVKLLTFTKMMI